MPQNARKLAIGAGAVLLALSVVAAPLTASSAEFSRRIAIAPFVNLTGQEEIKPVVSVLPRLLSTRLMALAGAETVVLPAGEKPPEEAAKEAKTPLLLQGTVTKLGKGYSIDATVTDLSGGRPAAAFFASATTEDDIIPQLGAMAGEISEKVFGVRPPVPVAVPQPAPARPLPGPAAGPVQQVPAVQAGTPQPPGPGASGPAPGPEPGPPTGPAEAWTPSSIKKIAQSDKIADELFGVVAGDVDEAGNGEVIAYGARTLYIYRVKGKDLLPYTRVQMPLAHHFLNVDAADLDGDGKKEIVVTDLVGEKLESFVLKRKGDVYEEAAGKIPYYLVVLPDWGGKPVVVAQGPGTETPFQGRFIILRWGGKGFTEGERLPHNTDILPLANGVLALSSARFGKEWRLTYTDAESHLRVVDASGKSEFKSRGAYGMGIDRIEWGPLDRQEGRKKQYALRKAPRLAGTADDRPLVIVPEVKKGLLNVTTGSYDSTRIVVLQWEGGEFQERAGSSYSDYFFSGADALSAPGLRKGGRVVAASIEQFGSAMKDRVSRLSLFQVD